MEKGHSAGKGLSDEKVVVIDFGGQYNQLIARRVRECNVYCEVHPYNISLEKIRALNPKGIIMTGGPNSVYEEGSAVCDRELFRNENGTVTSLVGREEFRAMQSEQFVDELFSGSLPKFLAAFTARNKLSEKEIGELREIIEKNREK